MSRLLFLHAATNLIPPPPPPQKGGGGCRRAHALYVTFLCLGPMEVHGH